MKESRQGLNNLLIVGISLVMAIGSIIAAIAEGQRSGTLIPPTPPQFTNTSTITLMVPITPTNTIGQTGIITLQPPSSTPLPPTVTTVLFTPSQDCNPPTTWVPYFVQFGITLNEIAIEHNTTPQNLKIGNCLQANSLKPGSVIFVPPVAQTPTKTGSSQISSCGPPIGWIQYTVVKGDNLYRLGIAFRVSVAELQWANCLGSSTIIQAGSKLWVPNRPTITPQVTNTNTPGGTTPPTVTSTQTLTLTNTSTLTATPSPSPTVSASASPTTPPAP